MTDTIFSGLRALISSRLLVALEMPVTWDCRTFELRCSLCVFYLLKNISFLKAPNNTNRITECPLYSERPFPSLVSVFPNQQGLLFETTLFYNVFISCVVWKALGCRLVLPVSTCVCWFCHLFFPCILFLTLLFSKWDINFLLLVNFSVSIEQTLDPYHSEISEPSKTLTWL